MAEQLQVPPIGGTFSGGPPPSIGPGTAPAFEPPAAGDPLGALDPMNMSTAFAGEMAVAAIAALLLSVLAVQAPKIGVPVLGIIVLGMAYAAFQQIGG